MPKPPPTRRDDHIDAKISQLRKLLLTVEDLDEVSDYFHNVLVLDDAFIASGERSSNPRLVTALEVVLKRVAPEGKLGTPLIFRLPEQALCHGYTTCGRGHVVFLYFEQLDLGFCSYVRSLSSAEVTFMRFDLTDAPAACTWGAWQAVSAASRGAPQ